VGSFSNRHHMYLFSMKNGKKKLAYGKTPGDALEILRIRLTEAEMAEVIATEWVEANQRDLQKYVPLLG